MKRALCIWLPNWPLQRLAVDRAELKDRAVVLYQVHPSHGARVTGYCARLSEAAAAPWQHDPRQTAGIRIGMPLAEAAALALSLSKGTKKEDNEEWNQPQRAQRTQRGEEALAGRRAGGVSRGMTSRDPLLGFQWDPSQSQFAREQKSSVANGASNPGAHAPGSPGEFLSSPLHLEIADPLADRAALEALASWSQRFGPSVGLEEGEEPESLLVDVTGVGALEGGEHALAERVVREFHQRGLTVRVAIADTLSAAWAVGRYRLEAVGCRPEGTKNEEDEEDEEDLPQRAQSTQRGAEVIAGRRAPGVSPGMTSRDPALRLQHDPSQLSRDQNSATNPEAHAPGSPEEIPTSSPQPTDFSLFLGLFIIPPGETWAALAPLPIGALRLPEETCSLLAELGIARIEQLAVLPRSTLLARFGPLALDRLDRATGAAPDAIVARAEPEAWRFESLLEHPTARREMIELVLDELVGRACQALARKRYGMLRLECRLEPERGAGESFIVGLYRPSAAPRHVGELVRLKLERLRFREPVAAVCLRVLAADRLEFSQQEMFFVEPEEARHSPRQLVALVDRLSNRLGSHAVTRPWLLAEAQPEFACQYQPLAGLAARRRGKTQRSNRAVPVPGDRPLFLEPRPQPLRVMSIAPEGPPVQVRLAGRDERIVRAWGPERIETSWWRTRCVRRDYYQVETAAGQRYWVFRHLNTGRWFLHGAFG